MRNSGAYYPRLKEPTSCSVRSFLMVIFPLLVKPHQQSIGIFFSVKKWKKEGANGKTKENGKRGINSFLYPSIFPFFDRSMERIPKFSMIRCFRYTKRGKTPIQESNLELLKWFGKRATKTHPIRLSYRETLVECTAPYVFWLNLTVCPLPPKSI